MSDWRIFRGDRTESHDEIRDSKRFPPPPKWRQFGDFSQAKTAIIAKDERYWYALQKQAEDNDLTP